MERLIRGLAAGIFALACLAVVPIVSPETAFADNSSVGTCSEAAFDSALSSTQSTGGGTITFACSGTIGFTSKKAITSDVTIIGGDAITLDGGDVTGLFEVASTGRLVLSGLTLQHGSDDPGAAVYNNGGTLVILSSTFEFNSAPNGGAVADVEGSTTIVASTFNQNTATQNGGAIYKIGPEPLTIIASSFDTNSATFLGGAILVALTGQIDILGSSFSSNVTGPLGDGGAIVNFGTLNIDGSTFSENTAAANGGAIDNPGGSTQIRNSTFYRNSADDQGGAINNINLGSVFVNESTFYANNVGFYGLGGAVFNDNSSLFEATANTFTANSSRVGGIVYNEGTATLVADTLSGNLSDGGTIQNSGSLTVGASIIEDLNPLDTCVNSGSITSNGYNLADDASCGLAQATDQQGSGVTFNLGTLTDNGGPTMTMLPGAGSDAIEAIPVVDCPLETSGAGQRGVVRLGAGANCEIGAVELGQVPVQIIATYNLAPEAVLEGSPNEIHVIAYGPAEVTLTYEFDCDSDGSFEVSQQGDASGECQFTDEGPHTVPIRVTDGSSIAISDTTFDVVNVAPVVESIELSPTPSSEGEMVELTASFADPGTGDAHTCQINWGDGANSAGVIDQSSGVGSCSGMHAYLDDTPSGTAQDSYDVSVQLCDDDLACDGTTTTQTVQNLPPMIDQIALSNGSLGSPVTVTVAASDAGGSGDPLGYAFDCDNDGTFEIGPQPENNAVCDTDPSSLSDTFGVRVTDDDLGATEQTASVSFSTMLCVDLYTGKLHHRSSCRSSEWQLVLTSAAPKTICESLYTGTLTYSGRGCSGARISHVVPGPQPVASCISMYTGVMRMSRAGGCKANEYLYVIPSA